MARRPTAQKAAKGISEFKTLRCKVLSYDRQNKNLDIDFVGYGVRIKNVTSFNGDYASVRYKGEIGDPGFICLLA